MNLVDVFISAGAHFYVKSFSYPLGSTCRITESFQFKQQEVNDIVHFKSGNSQELQKM